MPQSLAAIYFHIVYSTLDRRPFLRDPRVRADTHAYLGGIARKLECEPIRINGTEDHVHLLLGMGRTMTAADTVKELKRVSSLWLHSPGQNMPEFAWQSGYGVFSVSKSNLPKIVSYIENQEEHHREMSFEDEYRAFLRKHGIMWDERYVWE